LNLYIWEYQDLQGDDESPTIVYNGGGANAGNTAITILGPATGVGSLISAAAAFAYPATGGLPGGLERHHDDAAPILAASSHS